MKFFFIATKFNASSKLWLKTFVTSTFALLLFPTMGMTQSYDTLWTEDWEGNWIDNWNVTNGTWQVGTPTSGPAGTYEGQKCAATVLDRNYPDNADTRLEQLNNLIVPTADWKPRLRIWHWYNFATGDTGEVQIKFENGSWQKILGPFTHTSGGVWTPTTILLDDYADSIVQFAFRIVSDESNTESGWYIDDVILLADIIPVELTSITSKIINAGIQLDWTTAREHNNQGFEIHRRSQNRGYHTIGFVEGHGTTNEEQTYSYIDTTIEDGRYIYRLNQLDFDGTYNYLSEIAVNASSPADFSLDQNYPNPFNPTTTITYSIPKLSFASIKVFDMTGSEIATLVDEIKPAGSFEVEFYPSTLPSGVYFYRLQAGDFIETKKMVLLR
jgi:hypothetical protein